MEPSDLIENRTFDEIAIGDSASLNRTLSKDEIALFAVLAGDVNPAIIGHGMWGGALVAAVLDTRLPGPGTIYLGQDLSFRKPVGLGDTITVTVTAKEKRPEKHTVVFDCRCVNQRGEEVITGTTVTLAPTEKIRRPRVTLPEVQFRRHDKYQQFISRCAELGPVQQLLCILAIGHRSRARSVPLRGISFGLFSSALSRKFARSRLPKASTSPATRSSIQSTATQPPPRLSSLRERAKWRHS